MTKLLAASLLIAATLFAGCSGAAAPSFNTPDELSAFAGWRGAAPNSKDTFKFVVMSDRTTKADEPAWQVAVAESNAVKPDFVMTIGDLVQGYTADETVLRNSWRDVDAMTQKLDAPFFYCPGNHDVETPAARKIYTELHGRNGKTWYSFNYRSCHFVVMDSTALVIGQDKALAEAQWAWLSADLGAANRTARHIFIFEHHPLDVKAAWSKILPMLDPAKTTIFAGHEHQLSYRKFDGVAIYVLGPTGARLDTVDRAQGLVQMFAEVSVDQGRPTIAMIPIREIMPHDAVDRNSVLAKRAQAKLAASQPTSTPTSAPAPAPAAR